jgi:RNA polymerase sigma-70 factor, ECF subfamily
MTISDEQFERHRGRLRSLAYRMLGSVAEAEDVVQDAWLRWHGVVAADAEVEVEDKVDVERPAAFLAQTVSRLCLDRLKRASTQRERYVGPWLPEMLPEGVESEHPDPANDIERASDVSYALLMALQQLSAAERAAFLLHDVFDLDFDAIGQALDRSPAACRQLASRARRQIHAARPRY